jgi:hypothetical protein
VKKIAHHRYPLPAGMRSQAWRSTPDPLEDDWYPRQGITGMPQTVRISLMRSGERCGEPRLLTAADLHDTLFLIFGPDEARVRFICCQMEETGACELRYEDDSSSYLIERILHA